MGATLLFFSARGRRESVEVPGEAPPAPTLGRVVKLLLLASFVALAFLLLTIVAHAATGDPSLLLPAAAGVAVLTALAVATVCTGTLFCYLRYPSYRVPLLFVVGITLATLAAHAFVINEPPTSGCSVPATNSSGCIMDEGVYYVPAANLMLKGTQCGLLQNGTEYPSACNLEHPFLGKAFIAAGMALFGDTDLGYRIFQVLLGTFCLPMLFLVALKVSGSRRLAYLGASFLALDVMFFVHSGAGLIDVQQVFFTLLALLAYLYGMKVWKADKYVLAGVFLGLAGLTKETALFGAAAVVTFMVLFGEGTLRDRGEGAVKVLLALLVVFAAGMQVYDSLFASASFPTFLQQVQFILKFGSSLTGPLLCTPPNPVVTLQTGPYWCAFPSDPHVATPILPLNWITYYTPVNYYVDTYCLGVVNAFGNCIGGSYVTVGYWGVTNLVVTWAVFAWAPLAAVALYLGLARRRKGEDPKPMDGETRLAGLALVWFLWCYLPYYVIQYGLDRITYPYYILPAVPSLSLGAAYLVTRPWFPKRASVAYLAAAFVFFLVFFPDKSFLPVAVRELMGH